MEHSFITHWEQIDLLPHITITLAPVDEFGIEHHDRVVVIFGWLAFDIQLVIHTE